MRDDARYFLIKHLAEQFTSDAEYFEGSVAMRLFPVNTDQPLHELPKLCSVLCITYNHARFAAESLQSIFQQSYRNIEIVVVDDGSTDETLFVVESTLAASPFTFHVIAQENTGNVPQNINRARAKASGEVLIILSLDDILEPCVVLQAMSEFAKDDSLEMCACTRVHRIDDEGRTIEANAATPIDELTAPSVADLLECEFENIGGFYIQNAAIKATTFDAVGGCDEDLIGDDIILRTKILLHMLDNPFSKTKLIRRAGVRYRTHDANLHLNSLRQIRTAVEWRDRYFATRPLPSIMTGWIKHLIANSLKLGKWDDIKSLNEIDPEVAEISARVMRSGHISVLRLMYAARNNLHRLIDRTRNR